MNTTIDAIRRHGREHDRRCPGCEQPAIETLCSCGDAVTISCGCCGAAQFLAIAPGSSACGHQVLAGAVAA